MSVATTRPSVPTRRAAAMLCPPAPAATSSTRLPGPTPAPSSISSVASASHVVERGVPAVPGLGCVLPLLAGGRLVLQRVEAHQVLLGWFGAAHPYGARSGHDSGRFDLADRQTIGGGARMGRWDAPAPWLVGRDDAFARVSGALDAARAGERRHAAGQRGRRHGQDRPAAGGGGARLRSHAHLGNLRRRWGRTRLLALDPGLQRAGAPGGGRARTSAAGTTPGWWRRSRPRSGESEGEPAPGEQSERGRMLLLDAAVAWLQAVGSVRPVVDRAGRPAVGGRVDTDPAGARWCAPRVLGRSASWAPSGPTRRHAAAQARLAALVEHADHLALTGLDRDAAGRLAEATIGRPLAAEEVDSLFRRAGGHPFFTRELARAQAVATTLPRRGTRRGPGRDRAPGRAPGSPPTAGAPPGGGGDRVAAASRRARRGLGSYAGRGRGRGCRSGGGRPGPRSTAGRRTPVRA